MNLLAEYHGTPASGSTIGQMVPLDTSRGWVGGYHLHHEIGRGGAGTVWEAEDDGGNRVALKLLHPSVAATKAARTRLLREARLVNQVHSPHVARVLDVEADDHAPFVVTELIRGPTLETEIQRLPYRREDAAQIASELAEALNAVHDAGVAHRDLKPSNVILASSGPTLIDFGIAHGEGDTHLTMTGAITGTPGYVSPELLLAQETPSLEDLQTGDWFAWAALVLKALTARPPFGTGATSLVLQRVLQGRPDTDGLPDDLAAAFTRALSPEPEKRIPPEALLDCLLGASIAPLREDVPDLLEFADDSQVAEPPRLSRPASAAQTQTLYHHPDSHDESAQYWAEMSNRLPATLPPVRKRSRRFATWLSRVGILALFSWLPVVFGSAGLVLLVAVVLTLQVIGASSETAATQSSDPFFPVLQTPRQRRAATRRRVWRAVWVGALALIPAAALTFATAFALRLQSGQLTPMDAITVWLLGSGPLPFPPAASWLAIWLGLLLWWLLPVAKPARTGLNRVLHPITVQPVLGWLVTLLLLAAAIGSVALAML